MALPVLDGNQSATTLSSVVTGGEHIVAHSVVSLGATAISNINSAVSGTAVTIPGLARLGNSIASDNTADANLDFIKIGGHQDGQNQVAHIVHVSAGGAMKVDASGSSVTFSQAPVTFGAITGSASILNFPSTQTIAGTVTANVTGQVSVSNQPSEIIIKGYDFTDDEYEVLRTDQDGVLLVAPNGTIAVVGTVTANPTGTQAVAGTVTVSNQQTLISYSGQITATAGPAILARGEYSGTGWTTLQGIFTDMREDGVGIPIGLPSGVTSLGVNVPALGSAAVLGASPIAVIGQNQNSPNPSHGIQIGYISDISGTFVNVQDNGYQQLPVKGTVTVGSLPAISGTVTVSAISTSVTARLVDSTGTAVSYAATGSAGTPSTDVISVQGVSGGTSLPISGTAGTLTTRFGSVTTANTAQISSAVTNTSRKYLLIQNVTTSSNVITIGIGFTPTTTQGIQLTAGAGITFESSYIPTGAVYVLSSVTASPFTILEA